jgi:hypothetical protein
MVEIEILLEKVRPTTEIIGRCKYKLLLMHDGFGGK